MRSAMRWGDTRTIAETAVLQRCREKAWFQSLPSRTINVCESESHFPLL